MKIRLLLLLVIFPAFVFAQQIATDTVHYYNANQSIEYIKQFITLRFSQNTDVEKLAVFTTGNDVHLKPNSKSVSRLSLNYKFLSFSISFTPKLFNSNNSNELKGKTSGTGYSFNFNFKHWLQEVSYQQTKGYYLENTADYITGWKAGDPYLQFPKLVYQQFKGTTAYNFNGNFSVNALATQSERQLKSCGSFIPVALYRYYTIKDKAEVQPSGSSQHSKNFEILVGAGYHYTVVFKRNFYVNAGLTPGGGFVFTRLYTMLPAETSITRQKNAVLRVDGRTGMGYNGRRFFAGLYMTLSASTFNQEKTSAVNENSRAAMQAFFGYRFIAPRWLKDNVQKVSDKIHL